MQKRRSIPRDFSERTLMKRHKTIARSLVQALLLGRVVLGVSGCGSHSLADPEGPLDRGSDGTIRAGISHEPPWTDISSGDNTVEDPGGIEVQLIADYAQSIGAEVEWQAGGEE